MNHSGQFIILITSCVFFSRFTQLNQNYANDAFMRDTVNATLGDGEGILAEIKTGEHHTSRWDSRHLSMLSMEMMPTLCAFLSALSDLLPAVILKEALRNSGMERELTATLILWAGL